MGNRNNFLSLCRLTHWMTSHGGVSHRQSLENRHLGRLKKKQLQHCIRCRCPGTAQGLPCAGHSFFHPSSTDPAHGTAESPSHDSSPSMKMYLRKCKNYQTGRGGGEKKSEEQPCEHQRQRRSGAGSAWGTGLVDSGLFPCSPERGLYRSTHPQCRQCRTPCWSRWIVPGGTEVHGEPTLEHTNSMRKKEQHRRVVTD